MSDSSLETELQHRLEQFRAAPEGRAFAPLADCYRRMGRHDDARRVCEAGLEHHPTYVSAHVILGRIHYQQGHEARARATFEKVLELDPQNLAAMRFLAHAAERRGDSEAAIEYWRQVETFDRHDKAARARRERLEAERAAAAPVALVKALDEPPTLAEPETLPPLVPFTPPALAGAQIATVTLADIYYEQGFTAKALEIYKSVQREAPGTPGVDERVARIQRELTDLQQRLEATHGGDPVEESLEALAGPAPREEQRPSAPVAGPEPEAIVGDAEEDDDYDHFRAWLGRIKARPF